MLNAGQTDLLSNVTRSSEKTDPAEIFMHVKHGALGLRPSSIKRAGDDGVDDEANQLQYT